MEIKEGQRILEVKDLKQYYIFKKGWFGSTQITRAVDNVSFHLNEGEILGIVGESGCGKSTLLRSIAQLRKPTAGSVFFQGQDLTKLTSKELLPLRKDLQMVFQDPYSSLDPRMTVEEIISEPLWIYKKRGILKISRAEIRLRVQDLMEKVELLQSYITRYPHEFSGGQRQRVGIARALALNPRVILADEPVSALDVSIQSQILNLFKDLQEDLALSYIFVAHDLAVVKYISDRIIVMYLGSIVEIAPAEELYKNPIHPYTKTLLNAVPIPDPKLARQKEQIERKSQNCQNIEEGQNYDFTYYHSLSEQESFQNQKRPSLQEVKPGHFVACFLKKV